MAHPFRYAVILCLVALGTGLAAVSGWRYARTSAPVNGPIILISIDTLRADHLPAYGYQKIRTPAIDALATDGVVFERAYSHAPQTLPAHVSLLTGRLPFETGVRDNAGFVVPPSERLLPEMLGDRGYATAGIVSSYVLRRETGIARGFAFFDSEMPSAGRGLVVGELRRDGSESERVAERWLDSAGTSRAFLFLHLYEPHAPYAPPPQFSEYDPYDAEIAYADEIVGRLTRYLKAHQLYDRSTIVLLSDHGEGLGEHGEQEHGLLVYDDVIHVPLIIKQAAGEGAGRRVRDVVQHVDVVPTLLDLAKAPVPGRLSGRSLKPLLDNTGHLSGRTVYSEALYGRYHFGWTELTSLTDGNSQYIRGSQTEMYDLVRDPRESENFGDEGDERQEAFEADIERVVRNRPIPAPSPVSSEDRQRFEALGYVGFGKSGTYCSPCPGDGERKAAIAPAPDQPLDVQLVETYRAAARLATTRRWAETLALLQRIVRQAPESTDAWNEIGEIAFRAGRYDQALEASRQGSVLDPTDPVPHRRAADLLLRLRKLDEASREATAAIANAPTGAGPFLGSVHELLARIALARRDAKTARQEAAAAREADPSLPLPAFVEGRLLYDEARYGEGLEQFESATAELARSHGRQIENLHLYTAEGLLRQARNDEAESELLDEVRYFPQNARAWSELALQYQKGGRTEEAARTLDDLVRVNPTADGYTAAARLWLELGDRRRASVMRAEAARRGR